jgi:hypothetical protein
LIGQPVIDAFRQKNKGAEGQGAAMGIWDLKIWDQFVVYVVAGVFVCVGLAKLLGYKRIPRAVGAQPARLPIGLRYGCIVAVGLFEVVAALALVMPSGLLSQPALTQVAVAGLALVTVTAGVYHARRQESTVSNILQFLLVVYVALVRWV